MRPASYTSNMESNSGLRGDVEGGIGGQIRDRVYIENGSYSQVAPPAELQDKWEPIPAELYLENANMYPHHNADPLDFLSPAEAADLPDLDFPVPDQDVIPEMVFEHDEQASNVVSTPLYQAPVSSVVAKDTTSTTDSPSLIPIQSSVVAHARSGKLSYAAVQERRAKNTEAARRSRARRADKITELRLEKERLLAENAKLVAENRRLLKLVKSFDSQCKLEDH